MGDTGRRGRRIHSRASKTFATCYGLNSCFFVTGTVRTVAKGYLGTMRISKGATTDSIRIPTQAPDPPNNLSYFGKSPSKTLLRWDPIQRVQKVLGAYSVHICQSSDTCPPEAGTRNCSEFTTSESHMEFDSKVNTDYCVILVANNWCEGTPFPSRPRTLKFTSPVFAQGNFVTEGNPINPPEAKNGPLYKCVGTLDGKQTSRTFTCDSHDTVPAKVVLRDLQPGEDYNVTASYSNRRKDGQEMDT